jgi:hypothetical protein
MNVNIKLDKVTTYTKIKCFTIVDNYGEHTDQFGVCKDENNKLMYRSRKRYDDGAIILINTREEAEQIKEDLEKNIHKVEVENRNRKFEIIEVEI